jgi:hypothetical protein
MRRSVAAAVAACGAVCLLSSTASADPAGAGPLADGHAPAGVMFDHMHNAGEFMVGYRYFWTRANGDTLNGTRSVSDHEIHHNACLFPGQTNTTPGHNHCSMKQSEMTMQMHMLDIMYAPTDWLTLMVMPQWMTMDMAMAPLDHGGHMGGHMEGHGHGTDGLGDTIFGAMIRLSKGPGVDLHTSLMFTAPTGSVDEKVMCGAHGGGHGGGPEPCFTHYMMQLGSGTWDFMPSLTYRGYAGPWTWGAQIGGTIRMEDENDSGYRLGDIFQATAWGSYRFADWISASVRVLHMQQGEIEGHYNGPHSHSSPPDLQYNYGGRFCDIGFGINTVVPSGLLKGHRLSAEWLQPIEDDVNGYQQEREGSLWINWSKAF